MSDLVKNKHIYDFRNSIAQKFISGDGIEIGALHNPTQLGRDVSIKYVDRISLDELKKHYPEMTINNDSLISVDIIDNGEHLETFSSNSLNFIIANHFLEHCQNPISTIEVFLSKLKDQGLIFLAVPDYHYCFDNERKITKMSHLLRDYYLGPEVSYYDHYYEWVTKVMKFSDEMDIKEKMKYLINREYSIHFHVWDQKELHDGLINYIIGLCPLIG
jgi:predicted SAM-dependent methyltransferase